MFSGVTTENRINEREYPSENVSRRKKNIIIFGRTKKNDSYFLKR